MKLEIKDISKILCMGIIEQIADKRIWEEFYACKEAKGNMHPSELRELANFIEEERFSAIASAIRDGKEFALPTKRLVNKIGNTKKRVVYTFPRDENYVLKLIAHLLYKYDDAFSPNLYSFRKKFGVKRACQNLISHQDISKMCSYKVDIHDYFNSIDIDRCIVELRMVITDDPMLLEFIIKLLKEDRVICNDRIIRASHGIMAGMPVASFLANVYLRMMDRYFDEQGIVYARYSDDIIVFASTREELDTHIHTIKSYLSEYNLVVNPSKEVYTAIGDAWTFLGIQYCDGKIDISPISLGKVKAKLRRKARSLLRWKRRKGYPNIYAVRAFIKHINKYFYRHLHTEQMTWSRWYFPLLTTDRSLKAIDQYALELARYICTEKHTKSNYNFRYSEIKDLGYRPLVAEFYNSKADLK